MPRKQCAGPINPKLKKSKEALIELARTWTQAEVQIEHIIGVNSSPPEARIP
jgi:hypothetical protein